MLQTSVSKLDNKLKSLLKTKAKYLKQLTLLSQRAAEKEAEEENRKIEHESSIRKGEKQKEIDQETQKLSEEVAKLNAQIITLQSEVNTVKEELTTILIKIELKKKINKKRQDENQHAEYVPDRSDPIDVKMAEYVNVNETRVPIKRIEQGKYMFGRKEITITPDAKKAGGYIVDIPSEKLTISINELLTTYSEKELKELSKIRDDQQLVVGEGHGETIRNSQVR
jgi:hypothetical protein